MMGRLVLSAPQAGQPWRARIQNSPDMARTCVGLTPEEARSRLASLFSLCGAAHAAAATQALGLPEQDSPNTSATHDILRDHALELLHTWPRHLGLTLDRTWLTRTLGAGNDKADNARTQLATALTGLETPLALLAEADFTLWLEAGRTAQTPPPLAAVLAALRLIAPPDQGRADLPAPDSTDLETITTGKAPARDASILADHRNTPLLRGLIAREGVSLFVRMVARALDMLAALSNPARLFARTRALAAHLPAGPDGATDGRLGVARAARGVLVHHATIQNGRIRAYTVLSPTGWHMAQDGLLSRCLRSLPLTDSPALLPALLISAINPCVPALVEP